MINKSNIAKILLFSTISLSLLFFQTAQLSYSQGIRTFNVEAELEHKVIERGDNQKIDVEVEDADTDQPIAGALVEARVTYPAGEIVQSINSVTDANGETTISIPSDDDIEYDTAVVEIFVSLTGFFTAAVVVDYAIISEDINDDNDNDNDKKHQD